ncbi:MAG: hypothetical protein HOP11_15535 [Saprospiraceae bacterium]|nr:hypothetical protein [Saprospiraceae bacterium]
MKTILSCISRDFKNEWRNLYQLGGLFSFLIGVCYLIYFFGDKNQSLSEWNLKYWLVYLFLSFFVGSRIYEEDQGRFRIFLHQLVHPGQLLLSKIIFVFFLLTVMNMLILFFFQLFNPEIQVQFFNWLSICMLINVGMATLISFSSLLNSNIRNNTILLTVIILPISFPLIGMAYSTSHSVLEGVSILSVGSKLRLILGIDLITIAIVFFLYPHIARN